MVRWSVGQQQKKKVLLVGLERDQGGLVNTCSIYLPQVSK